MLKQGSMLVTVAIFLFQSCTNDKFETDPCATVSYEKTIQPLVNLKCAVYGCHVSGFLPGDFNRYEILKQKVDEGKLQLLVFELKTMPPVLKLTSEEAAILKCWISHGAQPN